LRTEHAGSLGRKPLEWDVNAGRVVYHSVDRCGRHAFVAKDVARFIEPLFEVGAAVRRAPAPLSVDGQEDNLVDRQRRRMRGRGQPARQTAGP
jgi:hypothetical protein